MQHQHSLLQFREQEQPGPSRTVSQGRCSALRMAGRAGVIRARLTQAVRRGAPATFSDPGPARVLHSIPTSSHGRAAFLTFSRTRRPSPSAAAASRRRLHCDDPLATVSARRSATPSMASRCPRAFRPPQTSTSRRGKREDLRKGGGRLEPPTLGSRVAHLPACVAARRSPPAQPRTRRRRSLARPGLARGHRATPPISRSGWVAAARG
jgi:hypothetical protein